LGPNSRFELLLCVLCVSIIDREKQPQRHREHRGLHTKSTFRTKPVQFKARDTTRTSQEGGPPPPSFQRGRASLAPFLTCTSVATGSKEFLGERIPNSRNAPARRQRRWSLCV